MLWHEEQQVSSGVSLEMRRMRSRRQMGAANPKRVSRRRRQRAAIGGNVADQRVHHLTWYLHETLQSTPIAQAISN